MRSELVADPDGDGLYWLESVRGADYFSDALGDLDLVRFDLQTQRAEVVIDRVAAPLQFIRDKVLVLRPAAKWRAMLVDDDGEFQELTPDYLDVLDVELLDDHTLALLAEGDGRRADEGFVVNGTSGDSRSGDR